MAVGFHAEGFLRTRPAAADFTSSEGRAVVISSGNAALAGANARILGILVDNPKQGKTATIQVAGQVRAVAGAAFADGVLLTTDASGRLVTATTGQNIVAQASEAASGAGAIVAVEVFHGGGGLAA